MVFLPIRWWETETQRYKVAYLSHYNAREQSLACWYIAHHLSARAAEAGGLPPAWGQFEIHSEFQTSLKYGTKRLCVKKQGNENISRYRPEVFQ